jgi:hypothetical protein
MNALTSQSSSLAILKLESICFKGCQPWEGLAACVNLRFLHIKGCYDIDPPMIAPLRTARFPYLVRIILTPYGTVAYCSELTDWAKSITDRMIGKIFSFHARSMIRNHYCEPHANVLHWHDFQKSMLIYCTRSTHPRSPLLNVTIPPKLAVLRTRHGNVIER